MQPVPLTIESPFERKEHRESEMVHQIVECGITFGAALIVLVILASVLRATEVFITTKLAVPEAHAATLEDDRSAYSAKLLLRTGEQMTMAPGATTIYTLGFKNTGAVTWKNSGSRLLSIYTYDPKYRSSPFYDSSWRLREQPTVMKDPSAPPGTVGFFDFKLHAPKTPGTYVETFNLAAEDLLWIPGGKFSITITVTGASASRETTTVTPQTQTTPTTPPSSAVTVQPSTTSAPEPAPGYAATLLLRSHKTEIALGPGETVEMTFGFKNSGTKTWQSQSLRPAGVRIAVEAPTFRHLSWVSPDEVVREMRPTKPGELAFLRFTLQSPAKKGSYRPTFRLMADNQVVAGGEVEIPVTVTADGAASAVPALLPVEALIPEPTLRVGLFKTRSPIMLTATDDYEIYDGRQKLIETVRSGQPSKIIFDFDYRTATVTTPTDTYSLLEPVRFVPRNANTIFTIPSYSHPTGWNKSLNDNRFRGTLEIYYVEDTGNLWVVDELPVEMYLRGLAETSNDSPLEYQKALITAARTYAFYHFSRNTKHGGHFHVDAEYDQVYRGYGNEVRTPNLTRAVEETRGSIATYDNQVAITPYYSRSDGRTRSWEEVWGGGPKPWLKSVPAPYDKGQTLWGHGVGMSARDALYRAKDGADWQTIVKYYYTGVDLVKKWQ